jgi:hypothetical protein
MEMWSWRCGHGDVVMEMWSWMCGNGCVVMDVWSWRCHGEAGKTEDENSTPR